MWKRGLLPVWQRCSSATGKGGVTWRREESEEGNFFFSKPFPLSVVNPPEGELQS